MIEVSVTATARQADPHRLAGKAAVVIDVLRATSVMVTALGNGAGSVIPVSSPDEALLIKAPGRLLCGEREAVRIAGFDCGNSPLEFTTERVMGKTLVMTTTNGTEAILRSVNARVVMIGSFLNLDRIILELVRLELPVELVCSGTKGEFSLDDFLLAGALVSGLAQKIRIGATDLALLARSTWEQAESDLCQALESCSHYRYLRELGYEQDLEYCFLQNLHPVLPILQTDSGKIVLIK